MSPASVIPPSPSPLNAPQSYTSPKKPSTPKSKSYHPYLIQSTSSSLLTRSNSSPSQPLSSWSNHRSSKSMNSLNHLLSPTPEERRDRERELGEKEKESRRRSMGMDSPSRPATVRRSGTLPDFLLASGSGNTTYQKREIDLPLNPKTWTPSELAQYLGQILRTGGTDGHGQVLPAPLVEDIKSWVLSQRISGRVFMRNGTDGWGSTRPPPFLPLLQSISRKLRRNSLGSKLDHMSNIENINPDESFDRGSILLEEDELQSEEDEEETEVTGVRRMAIAFDAKSSASEASASGDEAELTQLKPQWTGESVGERWKKWEEKVEHENELQHSVVVGRKRTDSVSSSTGGVGDVESSDIEDDDNLKGGTIKATPKTFSTEEAESMSSEQSLPGLTPPPPYTSSFPESEQVPSESSSPFATQNHLTPVGTPQRHRQEQGSFSVTPTLERSRSTAHTSALGIKTPESPELPQTQTRTQTPSKMTDVGYLEAKPNIYATLRGSPSGSGPRYPSVRSMISGIGMGDEEEDVDVDVEEGSLQPASLSLGPRGNELDVDGMRWTTARRVTLRPGKVQNLFGNEDQHIEVQVPTQEEGKVRDGKLNQEVEEKMEKMIERIKELEDKLQAATATATKSVTTTTDSPAPNGEKQRKDETKDGILHYLGLVPSSSNDGDGDGLPRRVRELPAYLFLVGVGVGAIMVRVLVGRR